MNSVDRAAIELIAHAEACYQPTHRYVCSDLRDFKHLNQRFYNSVKRHFESEGFTHAGDVEDETLALAPGSGLRRVLIRAMISPGGDVMLSAFHPRPKFWYAVLFFFLRIKVSTVIDCETEYSDGSFLVTTNASLAAEIENPPTVHTEFLPPGTSPEDVYARHCLRLRIYAELNPSTSPRTARTLDEVLASQNRLNALKAAFRGEIGPVTREELERASTGHPKIAEELHARIQEILAERERV